VELRGKVRKTSSLDFSSLSQQKPEEERRREKKKEKTKRRSYFI